MSLYATPGRPQIRWTEEQLTAFRDEISRARKKREAKAKEYDWDGNLERYTPKPQRDSAGKATWEVNVGADFRDVERKKAALFYDVPEVSLLPDEPSRPVSPPPAPPPAPGAPAPPPPVTLGAVAALHQELLNSLLGPRHANVKRTVLKCIFDVLCPAGVGPAKVGYDARTVTVDAPQMGPDNQPVVNPITRQPLMQQVQVPIYESWFISRCSPKGLLVPDTFRDTDFGNSPWLGYDFSMPLAEAKRALGLPEDFKPRGSEMTDKPYFVDDDHEHRGEQVTGCYIEYKAEFYTEANPDKPIHPEQIACIVFVDGVDQPVKHEFSPHQDIDPQTGRLTLDSIRGFTTKPLVLRDLSDSPWVPSDCTVTGALTKELNKYRTLTIQMRDGQRHVVLYDPEKLNPEVRAKVERGTIGAWIPVEPGMLEQGQQAVMQQVTTLQQGREAWTGQDYIERDRNQILGIDANQTGAQNRGSKTATEVQTVQRNSEARFEQERQRVVEWFLDLVRTFDTLVLRYCDARMAGVILGPERGQTWAQWKQALAGQYAYEIKIDSGKYLDIESDRRQLMQLLNMVGQSPHVNSLPIIRRVVQAFGLDPTEVIIDQPQPKGPEPQKATIALKGEDFNPTLPQFSLIVEMARQGGWKLSDEAVKAAQASAQNVQQLQMQAEAMQAAASAQPEPPGPQIERTLPRTPLLNKKQASETGALPGPSVQ